MGEFSRTPYNLAKMMNQPVLYVVRHGSTGDDDSYNSPVNPHLDEKGWKDAEGAAEFLSKLKTGPIITSGHHRTIETANVIGKRLGKTPKTDQNLDSLDVGNVVDAASKEEADRIIDHHRENPGKKIPGGESIEDLRNRVDPALLEGAAEGIRTGVPPIQVAHHSVQHEVSRVFNGDLDSALTKTGGVAAVYLTPQGLKAVPIFKPDEKGEG